MENGAYNAYDGTSRRLSDASSSDPSVRSWTATKWLGSYFCLPQVLEGGSYEPNEPPLRTGLIMIALFASTRDSLLIPSSLPFLSSWDQLSTS